MVKCDFDRDRSPFILTLLVLLAACLKYVTFKRVYSLYFIFLSHYMLLCYGEVFHEAHS